MVDDHVPSMARADMDQEATAAAAMDLLGFISDFLEVAQHKSGISENVKYGDGPLSARIWDISEDVEEKIFNAATFVFAGHDTTANTMSWLLYEVSSISRLSNCRYFYLRLEYPYSE